jgi:ribose transport system permease protein
VKPNSVQENSLYANDIRSSVLDGEYYSMRMRARRLFAGRSFRTLVAVYGVLVILLVSSLLLSQSADPWTLVKTVVGLATFTAIVAFGQYLVVLTGGLDLSIPSVMTLAGVMLTGISLGSNELAAIAIPIVLTIGGLVGLVNGLGIRFLRIAPVVMTLGVNVILSGVVLVYTGGTPSGVSPPFLTQLVQGNSVGGIPNIILILFVFVTVAVLFVSRTSFGRQLFAVGGNRRVAYLSGIHVTRVSLLVYVLSGITAAMGGIFLVGYSGQSYLTLGVP